MFSLYTLLTQFHIIYLLFFIAIMAFQYTRSFIYNVKYCSHWLVVGYTFWIVTFHYSAQFIGRYHLLFLYHFIVANNIQYNVWSHYREARYFVIGKELIAYFNNSLTAHLRRCEVIANGNRS